MYRLIVLLTAVAVPAAGASPALAASSGQGLRVTADATGSGVPVVTKTALTAAHHGVLAWHAAVALEPDAATGDGALAARPLLVAPTAVCANTAPSDRSARAPPVSLTIT
jgi:hypothetical protein